MADEFVQVELSMPTSDYAVVVFNNTPETYPTDTDIECNYTITSVLEPSTRDWVGIYKVGWRSAREYHCFDWLKIPDTYKKGEKFDVTTTFPASSLPHDDGEFYQFCYVTGSGHIRGASTPFQFRKPGSDEYVEVEDEYDDNILIIKTKTAMLEDKLSKVEREKEELSKTVEYLEKERESLLLKLVECEKSISDLSKEKATLAEQLQTMTESLEEQKTANNELVLIRDSIQEKMNTLNQEKTSWLKRLDENDEYINSLQQKIKTLVNEKDALLGRNKMLEEEKELFNKHFATSEDRIKGYASELDQLRQKLQEQVELSDELQKHIKSLQNQLTDAENKIDQHKQATKEDKDTITELIEKLQDCKDKLDASEARKELLNDEVSSLKQTLKKLSEDLENSTSETHNYKMLVVKHQEHINMCTEKLNSLEKALSAKEEELQASITEYRKLKEMNWEMETKEKAKEDGAQYALSMAYETLKTRYDKMRVQKEEAQKHLDEALCQLKLCEEEKNKVLNDEKERLRLGQEQYKERAIELQHLQRELKKLLKSDKFPKEVKRETESVQQSDSKLKAGAAEGTSLDTNSKPQTGGDVIEDDSCGLLSRLTDISQQLEKREEKKQKYKRLYQEEKDKRIHAEELHQQELEKKNKEIQTLEKELQCTKEEARARQLELQSVIDSLVSEMEKMKVNKQSQVYVGQYPPQRLPTTRYYGPCPPVQLSQANACVLQMRYPQFHPVSYPPRLNGIYPVLPQAPPIPPRMREPAGPDVAADSLSLDVGDVAGDCAECDTQPKNDLDTPVPQLPRPLSPQRSPEAIKAQLRAINEGAMSESGVLAADEDGESFHDAREGLIEKTPQTAESPVSLRQCPVCQMAFPITMSTEEISQHVEEHLARTCPVCCDVFDQSVSIELFEKHVNCHFPN